jgi:hypothetical protein
MTELFSFTDIKVIHYRQYIGQPHQVYCARTNAHYKLVASPLANIFHADTESDRDRVCDLYEQYFDVQVKLHDKLFMDELERLLALYLEHGKLELMCWCKPKRCHCDTIQRYLVNRINEQAIL